MSVPSADPFVVGPGEGRDPDPVTELPTPTGNGRIEVKLDRNDGAGFSMTEYTAPPRFSPPPVLHRHTRESAGLFMLEGEVSIWFEDDDEPRRIRPRTFVWLPRGSWFRWANETDQPARWLNFFTPPGFDHFFAEAAAAVAEAGGFSPEVMARVIPEVRARYGDEPHPDA